MNDRTSKFMLVVADLGSDGEFPERLTRYMASLPGSSLVHVALLHQEDPRGRPASDTSAPIIAEWFADETPNPGQWADALSVEVEQLHWYAVSEVLRWNRPGTTRSSVTGISHICCVGRSAGLSEAQFQQHWTQVHRPLAQEHHVGMELYVQNVVCRMLGPGGQELDGIAELGFSSVQSFQTEMYGSEEGFEAIQADVSTFVGSASCGLYRLVTI